MSSLLRKIKTLGEDDPWLDDTAAWIERSRQLQKEKDLAEKRVRTPGGVGEWPGVGCAQGLGFSSFTAKPVLLCSSLLGSWVPFGH